MWPSMYSAHTCVSSPFPFNLACQKLAKINCLLKLMPTQRRANPLWLTLSPSLCLSSKSLLKTSTTRSDRKKFPDQCRIDLEIYNQGLWDPLSISSLHIQKFKREGENEGDLGDPDLFDLYLAHKHATVTAPHVEKAVPFSIELLLPFVKKKKNQLLIFIWVCFWSLVHWSTCLYFHQYNAALIAVDL